MSKRKQKRVIIEFYVSAEDRADDKNPIDHPSIVTTVAEFRRILERNDLRKGPYLAYFDENGNDLGAAGSAEDHLSG